MRTKRVIGALAASMVALAGTAYDAGAATKTTKKAAKTTKRTATTKKGAVATSRPATTLGVSIDQSGGETAPTPTAPPNVNPDGEIKIGYLGGLQNLDPHKSRSPVDWVYQGLVFDRLVQVDDDMKVQPMLASAWKFAPDGKSIELTLRRDIVFQDGSPITAAAVKANIERGKTVAGSTVTGYLAPIVSVDAVNNTTVRLNLSGNGGASILLSLSQGPGMIINPKAFGKSIDNGPGEGMGSGPYRIVSTRALESTVYERANFKYWDPSAGLAKKLTVSFLPASTALTGIKAGDVTLGQMSGVTVADMQIDEKAGRVQALTLALPFTVQSMLLKASRTGSPMANKTFRQALAYGVNKNAIGQFLFSGNCKPTETYYPKGHWAWNADTADRYRFDPTRAKQMLRDAGLANATIKMTFDTNSTTYRPIAEAVADQLERELGIRVQLDPQPTAGMIAAWQSGQTDIVVTALAGPLNSDPEQFFASTLMPNAATPFQLGVDPAAFAAKAVPAANPALSEAQRAALYKPIFDDLQENVYYIPICNQVQAWTKAANSKLAGPVQGAWSSYPTFRKLYISK